MLFTYDRSSLCVLYKDGVEPSAYSSKWNCTTIVLLVNLLRCAAPVAEYPFGVPNTTHHVPFVLRTTQSSFAIGVILGFLRTPLTTKTALKPLVATPRTITLPFLIPIDKLVLSGSQHHLLLFMYPGSLTGQSTHILSHTLASLLQPPVLSVIASSRM